MHNWIQKKGFTVLVKILVSAASDNKSCFCHSMQIYFFKMEKDARCFISNATRFNNLHSRGEKRFRASQLYDSIIFPSAHKNGATKNDKFGKNTHDAYFQQHCITVDACGSRNLNAGKYFAVTQYQSMSTYNGHMFCSRQESFGG